MEDKRRRIKGDGRARTDRVKRREREKILRLHEDGHSNLEIAVKLKRTPKTVGRVLNSAKKQALDIYATNGHVEDMRKVVRQWTKQLYYADTQEEADILYIPNLFRPIDGTFGPHQRGDVKWRVGSDGSVELWFEMEEHRLFGAVREHLKDTELLEHYEEFKSCLADGVSKASRERKTIDVGSNAHLLNQVREETETLLESHRFPGRCPKCP